MLKRTMLLTAMFSGALIGYGANAQAQTLAEEMTTPLNSMPDEALITLSGIVGEVGADEFKLNYGTDEITVELDRFGWTGNETNYLVPGESVTVRGYIDDDLFEGREIEAYNLRLNDSYVYYYTTDVDPVYFYTYDVDTALQDGTEVSVTGRVSNVGNGEFTVTNDNGAMRVDIAGLGYDPLDDEGLQKVEAGDRVYVYGQIDNDFFEAREITADGIVELVASASDS